MSRISYSNTLMCLFSYNMTTELRVLLMSVETFCPEFDMIVIDDASVEQETKQILTEYRHLFLDQLLLDAVEKTNSRGRLAENIQLAYEIALEKGYEYLFLVQDDMQFVRPLSEDVLKEYSAYFEADHRVVEVDPRFLRRMGAIEIHPDLGAYAFSWSDDRSSYADVGILSVKRLDAVGWRFESSERKNKEKAHALGFRRVFPFTPVMMHLPYPTVYRKGKRKNKFPAPLLRRGHVRFQYMTEADIAAMDNRPFTVLPYARDFLRPKGLGLACWHYHFAHEGKVFA